MQRSKLLQLKSNDDEEKKLGLDPNAINLKLAELVRFVHGSLESKQKLIDDFNEAHPECSKNSIEKRIKECFEKDKRGDDPKHRYYAQETLLSELKEVFPQGLETPELVELAKQRI